MTSRWDGRQEKATSCNRQLTSVLLTSLDYLRAPALTSLPLPLPDVSLPPRSQLLWQLSTVAEGRAFADHLFAHSCGLETGGDVYACKVFAPYLQSNPGCKPENPVVDEPNGLGYSEVQWTFCSSTTETDCRVALSVKAIKALPGNNPIWSGNSTTKPSDPNFNTTSPGFTVVKSVLPTGYSRTGCIAEASSGRIFTAASTTSDDMTLAVCAAFCATFELPYAGVEYGRE